MHRGMVMWGIGARRRQPARSGRRAWDGLYQRPPGRQATNLDEQKAALASAQELEMSRLEAEAPRGGTCASYSTCRADPRVTLDLVAADYDDRRSGTRVGVVSSRIAAC
jgi:hypothetical protein